MKKIISVLVSAAMLLTAVSCTKSNNNNSSGGSTVQAEPMLLKAADIEMSQDFSNIISLDRSSSSGSVLIFGELKSGDFCGYVTDESFSEHTEFRIDIAEDESVLSATMLPHDKKAVLSWRSGITRITVFGRDNQQESVIECEDVISDPMSYARIFSDGDEGFVIWAEDCLSAVSAEGKYRGEISTGGMSVYGITADAEGSATCLLMDKGETYLAQINSEKMSLDNKMSCGKMSSSALTMCAGAGEYELAGVVFDGLYGLKDGSFVKLCDFMDNTFSAYDVSGLVMTGENEFAAMINTAGKIQLRLLTERDISEIKAKKIVKIATSNTTYVQELAKRYNLEHEDGEYRIEIVNYIGNGIRSEGFDALRRDIISGNAPDILEFTHEMPLDTFGAKESMFADMYNLLDNDPDLSREDFLPNILKGLERGGKLLQIAPTFTFSTIMARPGYAGIKENWSVSDMIEAYENLPEGAYMFPNSDNVPRIAFYDNIVNESFFVDYEKAECYFDSPEYTGLLDFLIDNNIGRPMKELTDGGGYASDFLQDGIDVIGLDAHFLSFPGLHELVNGKYNGDVIFAGRPFDGKRSGSAVSVGYRYGIMANSENTDGAWDFIKMFFSDYYYNELHGYEFPTLTRKFNERADETTRDYTYTDYETGEVVTKKWTYQDNKSGEMIEIENFTPEECEYYKNIIMSADLIEYDSTISNICNEELNKLFEGECTTEECAKMIQSRVSLYLSERYQ